ncbi:hypothetical protein BDN72DRAFT_580331 [Pluteus cervinus]|uniref:Uncharacterized protein n=1 Tax=Pluteus cervinus TaxID=181527 RepID=A0ACD3AVS1_9AGAR|nr:hypothetical protein BDN72DRAFT_580331 [Pluteus cervinus]
MDNAILAVDAGGDALPFTDLDDSNLHHTIAWELQEQPNYTFPYEGCWALPDTLIEVQVGEDYSRTYDFNVDSTFNVVKAAMMREERMRKRHQYQFKNLTKLLTMPLEIILTVFDHLHPIDLYHLGMVSRSMRRFVYSWSSLWESAWEKSGMPHRPRGWTYKQWTALLFGPAVCDSCGKFVALPDYAHLKRYCTKCLGSEFTWDDLQDDPFLASTIPGTIRNYGWELSINQFGDSEDYGARNKAQIQLMRDKLKELRALAKKGTAGDESLATFVQMKQEEVHKDMEHARRCDEWVFDLFTEFSQGVTEAQRRARQRLQKPLKKQGFVDDDFSGWEDLTREIWNTDQLVDLTKSSWKRCIPLLMERAQNDKAQRLLKERLEREAQRRAGLLDAYTACRRAVKPQDWWMFPSEEEMLQLPACLDLVNDPSEKVHDKEGFARFIDALAGEFTRWHEDKRNKLVSSLPPNFSATSLPIDDQLELAMAVFSCPGCAEKSDAPVVEQVGTALFGWGEAKQHLSCLHLQTQGVHTGFDPIASDVVLSLLKFLGLQETTTAKELDGLNQRFFCGRCTLFRASKVHGLHAMTWRECVLHVLDYRRKGGSHNVVGWHLPTAQVHDYIIRREPHDPKPMDRAWYCTHCSVHFSEPALRSEVVQHLRSEHNLKQTAISIDALYSPLERRTSRKQLFIPIVPNGLRCNLCSVSKDRKFFDRTQMQMHVKNKHGVEPDEKEHWETVQPILRSSSGIYEYQITSPGVRVHQELPETKDAINTLMVMLCNFSDFDL